MARTAVFILLLLVHRIVAAGGEQVIPLARLNRIDDANTHNMPVNDVLGLAGAHQWSPVLLLDSIRLKNEERKKERKKEKQYPRSGLSHGRCGNWFHEGSVLPWMFEKKDFRIPRLISLPRGAIPEIG